MKVRLFNPENDLALGIDCLNYTPSPHAKALHDSGRLFPTWWAGEDDYVIAPGDTEADREWLRANYGIVTADGFGDEITPAPWGWSRNARRQFLLAGVPESSLPDDSLLADLRQLSHRRTATRVLEAVGYEGVMPLVTDDTDAAMNFLARLGDGFVKSPWSGSGRGVFNSAGLPASPLRRRIEGIIHRQGNVIIERTLDKVLDFAALYRADAQGVKFHGLSVFEAEARGMYAGNIVAPQEFLRSAITRYVSDRELDEAVEKVRAALSTLLQGRYCGPLGVDMMVYRDGDELRIMPCIEVNLRMTMGFVAMEVARRLDIHQPRLLTWHCGTNIPDGAIPLLRPGKEFTPVLEPVP